ncbi:hotdog domain-containing protein [Caenimonas aquaedulcis]|uniref:Thioesterase domain-containing protein n=1 Tax=Caenimonas aquaedulcis TaxID=2793270 RepID=A0A931MG14_9BURK|nr:hotdog domain-containing protein [Caenimonas aquaedulcis]MBG9387632.1 hypothetical protein [Caenimonas aquaedulcis]
MEMPPIPFRLCADARKDKLQSFNDRAEIRWFGFRGSFAEPAWAEIEFERVETGALGGGGTAAINGGAIAAGFDAAFVLAGLGHYDCGTVVTLELAVQFLSLARAAQPLVFRAGVLRSSRGFAFARGALIAQGTAGAAFATATAMIAPSQSSGRAPHAVRNT